MKLFSTYCFNFSKSPLCNSHSIFDLLQNLLFNRFISCEEYLYTFSLIYSKRKNTDFFQKHLKLGEIVDTKKNVAPNLNVNECTLSNYSKNWLKNSCSDISTEEMNDVILEALNNNQIWIQFIFNRVSWFHNANFPLTSEEYVIPSHLYPFNDNICIHRNAYDKCIYVYSTFEYAENNLNIEVYKYVNILMEALQVNKYDNQIWRIYKKDEIKENEIKQKDILKIIKTFQEENAITFNTKVNSDKRKISVSSILQAIVKKSSEDWKYSFLNRTYSISKIDSFHNQLTLGFDYSDYQIIGYVNYLSPYFDYSIGFKQYDIVCQDDLKFYITQIYNKIEKIDQAVLSIIRSQYEKTPEHFLY